MHCFGACGFHHYNRWKGMGFHERRPLSLAASFLAKDISPSFQRLMRHRMEWIRFNRHPCPLSCSMCKGSFYKLGLGKPIKSSSASGIYEGRMPLCFLRGIAALLSDARLPVCLLNKESRNRRIIPRQTTRVPDSLGREGRIVSSHSR
jgi:hypothetical protein